MKNINSKQHAILIFAGLAGFTIFAFQNCSTSFYSLLTPKPVQASDVSDMLRSSEKELKVTKQNIRAISSSKNEHAGLGLQADADSEENVLDRNVRYRSNQPDQSR